MIPTRKALAKRLLRLAEDLSSLETHDARLAADIVGRVGFLVQYFEHKDIAVDRLAWTAQLVAGIEALAPNWCADARWWLPVTERAALEQCEAEERDRCRRGDYSRAS